MKKVTRIITIEGPDEWVDNVINNSLPQGLTFLGTDRSIDIMQDGRLCNNINSFITPDTTIEDIEMWKKQMRAERTARMSRY
jgi:hypothetical protein